MKRGIIGLAILASLAFAVNVQAQSGQASAVTSRASLLGLGGAGSLPPGSGPPANATPEFLVAEGNALLAAGYTDAAIQDFQRVVNVAPDSSAVCSKGWYGLARGYMAQGNIELAKTSLEEVLSRNNDPESMSGSRTTYAELKSRADLAVSQAQQAVLYLQYRYHSITFMSFITKYFAWQDLKRAQSQLEAAQQVAGGFNPRYLIAPVGGGGTRGSETATGVSTSGLTSILSSIPMALSTAYGTPVVGVNTPAPGETAAAASTPAPAASATAASTTAAPAAATAGAAAPSETGGAAATPVAATAASAPVDDLRTKRDAYLLAYKNLQTAIGTGNAASIQTATKAFQDAMRGYDAARNRAASSQ